MRRLMCALTLVGHAQTGRLTNAQQDTKRVCVQVISTSSAANRVTKHVNINSNHTIFRTSDVISPRFKFSGQNNENVWATGDSQCKAANGNCMINTNYCDGYFKM